MGRLPLVRGRIVAAPENHLTTVQIDAARSARRAVLAGAAALMAGAGRPRQAPGGP